MRYDSKGSERRKGKAGSPITYMNQVTSEEILCFLKSLSRRGTPTWPAKKPEEKSAMLFVDEAPVPRNPEMASKSTLRRILIVRFLVGRGAGTRVERETGIEIGSFSTIFSTVVMTSSFFHTILPSIPPSTLKHSPEIWPAAL